MQVFISWSGVQSNAVAVALRSWLPRVLADRVTPFVSSEDIDRGARGLTVIADQLERSAFGVVVVTPSNQSSTWINFEAGALGKSVSDGRVAPLLVGLADADLSGPLKQFQNTSASDRAAVLALVSSVNSVHPDPLPADTVATLFAVHWPELESAIASSLELDTTVAATRNSDDLLDEVLTTVRSLQRDVARLGATIERPPENAFRVSNTGVRFNNVPGHTRVLDWTDPADPMPKLLSLMVKSSGGSIQMSSSDQTGTTIVLSKDTPTLQSDLLEDFQGLARSQGMRITLQRENGSSISYDHKGLETRTAAPPTVQQVLLEDEIRTDAEADENAEEA